MLIPLALHRVRYRTCGSIAIDGIDLVSGQKLPEFVVTMPREVAAQILSPLASCPVTAQQPLDRVRNLGCSTAVSNRTRNRLHCADRAAYAEVIGINQRSVHLELFAFQADVGDPVLAAALV